MICWVSLGLMLPVFKKLLRELRLTTPKELLDETIETASNIR